MDSRELPPNPYESDTMGYTAMPRWMYRTVISIVVIWYLAFEIYLGFHVRW